jgi:type IV secretory pathway VirD2 relaxase
MTFFFPPEIWQTLDKRVQRVRRRDQISKPVIRPRTSPRKLRRRQLFQRRWRRRLQFNGKGRVEFFQQTLKGDEDDSIGLFVSHLVA